MTTSTWRSRAEPIEEEKPELSNWRSRAKPVEEKKALTDLEKRRRPVIEQMSEFYGENPESEEAQEFRELSQTPERLKGIASELTFGATEHAEGLKPSETEYGFGGGQFEASLLTINGLYKLFTKGALKIAQKSPVLVKQAKALANIIGAGGAGATYEGTKTAIKGEVPDADDLIAHGVEWSLLEAAINSLGWGARFAKALFKKSQQVGKPSWQVVNDTLTKLKESGMEISADERVMAKAMDILEQETPEAKGKLSKMERIPSDTEQIAQRELLKGQLSAQESVKPINLPEPRLPGKVQATAQEAIKPTEVTAQELATRKAEPLKFRELSENHPALAEPIMLEELNAKEAIDEITKSNVDRRIEKIAPRAMTEQELGQNIQKDVQQGLETARNTYGPKYEQAEEAARFIQVTPQRTARIAGDTLRNLDRIRTRPTGYANVIRTLEDVLTDIGFIVERNQEGVITAIHGQVNGANTSDLMELGRRLNEIVEYDVLDASIKNRIKPVVTAVKSDIRTALAKDQVALNAFNEAERMFADTAKKYGKSSVRKVRTEQSPERIANLLKNPSALTELKEVLNPEQYAQVERELLEKLKKMKYDPAKKAFREMRGHLSTESQEIAREVIDSKLPLGKDAQIKQVKTAVLDDIAYSINTGERPARTLKLWQSHKGQAIIKDALNTTPNKNEILHFLEDQSFSDFVKTVVDPEGVINFQKFNKLVKDPTVIENIRLIAGDQGVLFFKNLERRSIQLEKNLNLIEKLPSGTATKPTKTVHGEDMLKRAAGKAKEPTGPQAIAQELKLGEQKKEIKPKRGEHLLEKAAEKANTPTAPESIAQELELGKVKKAQKTPHGEQKLKGIYKREHPSISKIEDLVEHLGYKGQYLLKILGLVTLGVPQAVISLVGTKLLMRLAKDRKVQKLFINASGPHKNPLLFIKSIELLDEALNAEET